MKVLECCFVLVKYLVLCPYKIYLGSNLVAVIVAAFFKVIELFLLFQAKTSSSTYH